MRARFVQYHQRVLATDPIVYWMLDEKSGTVAYDLVSGRVVGVQNGTHTGVTLGQDGIRDGRTSPFYDSVNDYTNVHSATFAAAFNGNEGTVAGWAKVFNADVWADGVYRIGMRIAVDGNNRLFLSKAPGANTIQFSWRGGGGAAQNFLIPSTSLEWMHWALTWSRTANETHGYLNGIEPVAAGTTPAAWAGALLNTETIIGAKSTVPVEPWDGWLAHWDVWDRPLPPAEIADLVVVE